jgi:hypothetical protein
VNPSPLVLLLRSLNDLTYEPPTSTGQIVQRQSRPGEGPSTRIACHSCQGEGEVRKRGIAYACEVCRARGWIVVDAYTLKMIGTEETGTIHRVKAVRCDACAGNGAFGNQRRCERCGGSGWVEFPLTRLNAMRGPLSADASPLGAGSPIIACMERRAKAGGGDLEKQIDGSYETLGLALAALRLELPRAYRTVVRVYVEAAYEPEELSEQGRLRHDVGLAYLGRLMPEEIRVPNWAARNERRRRDELKRKQREQTAA